MPIVVGSREGWELYVVTGGVMVRIYPDNIQYNIQLPSFSASYDTEQLSRIMFDSLMMAF
jgi:hypothetical protein